MYKNYEHFTENKDEQVENEQVEYDINSEYLENEEENLDSQYDEEINLEENEPKNDEIDEKIKNNEIIKLDDFDTTTDLLQTQLIKNETYESKKKHMKKGIEIIIYVIIGLLIAVIIGIFLKHHKIVKKESIIELVEPPKLY